ncbi:MAG TPA: response regulator [Bryobacteraceae bacterium]|nr:response regulator [Bryobacteraceae bacterium]
MKSHKGRIRHRNAAAIVLIREPDPVWPRACYDFFSNVPTILIVDDEKFIRHLLSAVFGRAGFTVQTASTPAEAMQLCQSDCFDVVLSDVVMPGMDGHALARWIAARCPRSRVVLMSGFDPGCDECPYAPRCPLVHKPLKPAALVALISEVLDSPFSGGSNAGEGKDA